MGSRYFLSACRNAVVEAEVFVPLIIRNIRPMAAGGLKATQPGSSDMARTKKSKRCSEGTS